MSRTTIVTVQTTNVEFSYSTGSSELANMFDLYWLTLDGKKFKGVEEVDQAYNILIEFLKLYPRNKHIQFMLDEMDEAKEMWKLIRKDTPDYPLRTEVRVRLSE
jgi:hypothetical protein